MQKNTRRTLGADAILKTLMPSSRHPAHEIAMNPPRALLVSSVLLGMAWLALPSPAAAGPSFVQVAGDEGVDFARAGDGADPEPSFVEIMGGGACWLDVDGDGDQDLFLVNGWYNDSALAAARQPRSVLFRNDGPRAGADFADATAATGLDIRGWTQGCAAADYDADGLEDLFVVGYGIQSLFRNLGDGTFANVTAGSGIVAAGTCGALPCWGSGAAWADYDRDGCLDLYVITFVAFDLAAGGTRGPGRYDGQPNQLYRSRCDGTFQDVTAEAGADGDPGAHHGKDWGVTWLDYDRDGWLDLYIASDGVPNVLYRNNADGTFTDTAPQAGVADPRNGMGVATGDCDEDGDEDLFFTHYESPEGYDWWGWDGFFVNLANGTFEDHSGEGDLQVTEPWVKWGVGWEDFDNDRDLDLHVVAGHTENDTPDPDQPHLLWTGDGACHYTDARATGGPAVGTARMSRGSSYADWDLDGALDAVVVNLMDQFTEVLRGAAGQGHWLNLELRQPGGNARGIGARVAIETPDGHVQQRRLMPYQSIHGSNAAQLHVGLGAAASADITVTWPEDLATTRFEDLPADRVLRLHRSGVVARETLAPESRLDLQGLAGDAGWWRTPVEVRIVGEDRGVGEASGVVARYLSVDGGPEIPDPGPVVLAEGPHTLSWRSVDAAGNAEPVRRGFVGVDTVPPVSEGSFEGTLEGGWYQGPVRATLACADGTSGVGRVEWRLDAGAWHTYTGPFDLTRPGGHAFAWRCLDRAGNPEAEHTLALAIDLGRPETLAILDGLAGLAGWWRSAVEVRLDAAGGPRAVAGTLVAVDGGPLGPYTAPLTLAAEGVHEVRFHSTDDAGNVEPLQTLEVRIDSRPPALRFVDSGPHVEGPGGLVVGPNNALHAAADEAGSGLARLEVRLDWEPWRPAGPVFRLREPGPHRLEARGADAAGNLAELLRPAFLDLEPPAVEVLRPRDQAIHVADLATLDWDPNPTATRALLLGSVTLQAGATDAVAGVGEVRFYVNGALAGGASAEPWTWTWDLPPQPVFVHYVEMVAEDRVGNLGVVAFEVLATGDPAALVPEVAATASPGPRGIPPAVLLVAVVLAVRRARKG